MLIMHLPEQSLEDVYNTIIMQLNDRNRKVENSRYVGSTFFKRFNVLKGKYVTNYHDKGIFIQLNLKREVCLRDI